MSWVEWSQYCTVELDIPAKGQRSTTFKRKIGSGGLEPDECFTSPVSGCSKDQDLEKLNPLPPPDLVVEVEITSPLLDKLEIYAGLGVPEIWRHNRDGLTILCLGPDGRYAVASESRAFPFLPIDGFRQQLAAYDPDAETTWSRGLLDLGPRNRRAALSALTDRETSTTMPTQRTSATVGIDLGTTNSVVASLDAYGRPVVLANRDGRNITPSVIYFGSDPPAVGDEAKEWARLGNDEIASFFKPHMGSPSYRLQFHGRAYDASQLSSLILRRLKEDAESALGCRVDRAVVTVPAYFADAQRKATIEAARMAGLEVARILNEPTAAALAYGLGRTV